MLGKGIEGWREEEGRMEGRRRKRKGDGRGGGVVSQIV